MKESLLDGETMKKHGVTRADNNRGTMLFEGGEANRVSRIINAEIKPNIL